MVPFVPVGVDSHLAAAVVLSRWRGALRVTVVAKATLGFAADGEMAIAPPVEMVATDVHAAKNPMRSVRVSSDLSPHLERTDVLFVGRAHAPSGTKVERTIVRLAILDDRVPVLDKRLAVVGDRAAPDATPKPFDSMPIVYERAYGGLRFPENPLGVGIGGDGKIQPNVLHVDASQPNAVAGFGPRSTSWLVRKKLLRGHPRPPTEGVAELADDFDWIYFQAAPPDQWLDALPPRAWIVLEGLNARARLLRMRLPPMRVWARLEGPRLRGPHFGEAVELRPDTLFIDGDAEHCTVAWRGTFDVPDLEALTGAWGSVAAEIAGRPVAWPPRPEVPVATGPGGGRVDGAPRGGALPLVESAGRRTRHVLGGTVALDDLPRPASAKPTHASTGTMIVGADALAAATAGAPAPQPGTLVLEQPAADLKAFGTMIVETAPPAAPPLPFVGADRAKQRRNTPAPLPGAPWAAGAPAKKPRPTAHPLAETQAPSTRFRGKGDRDSSRAPAERAHAERAEAERADAQRDQAKRAADAEAKEAERRRAEAAAIARREAEREEEARAAAERFAKEQAAARKTDAEREASVAAEKARGIKDLKKKAYGGFDD